MQYNSTRNHKQTASPAEAVLRGIAPDGGLYLCDPATLPLDPAEMLQKDFAGDGGGRTGAAAAGLHPRNAAANDCSGLRKI